MIDSVQRYDGAKDEALGVLMDEAIAKFPKAAFFRMNASAPVRPETAIGLILCVMKGSPTYEYFAKNYPPTRYVPASGMRVRTIHATFMQAWMRQSDISCYTENPDSFIFATVNPEVVDYLFREVLKNH